MFLTSILKDSLTTQICNMYKNKANSIHTNSSYHLDMKLERQGLGEAGPCADLMCIIHSE